MAAELIALQNGPCDLACIYDARCGIGNYSPLFDPSTYKPRKAYYAFTAFDELRRRGTAVKVEMSTNDNCHTGSQMANATIHAAAARGSDGSIAVMLANDGDEEAPFALEAAGGGNRPAATRCRITDETRTDEEVPPPAALPPHAFAVFTQER